MSNDVTLPKGIRRSDDRFHFAQNQADQRKFHRSTHASAMIKKVDIAWVPLLSTSIAFATVRDGELHYEG